MGTPEWTKQEIFKDRWSRAQYIDAVEVLLTEWFMQYTKKELFHLLQAARIPVGPENSTEDLFEDPHLKARNFFVEIDYPVIGKAKYPGPPYVLSETPWRIRHPAPLLGEHNQEIYCDRLGYTRQDLIKIREAHII
jgi:crotonobetainyl-CoA:carnitine CoA-transferase CaiB-like acyl-CoA transferase